MKDKQVASIEDSEKYEGHITRKRTRTMGLKKVLQKEKDQKPTDKEPTFDERIAKEINEDKEYWLSRVNDHLD